MASFTSVFTLRPVSTPTIWLGFSSEKLRKLFHHYLLSFLLGRPPQWSSGLWIVFLNWPPKSQVWVWHRKEKLAQTHPAQLSKGKAKLAFKVAQLLMPSLPPPFKFLQCCPLNSHHWMLSVNATPQNMSWSVYLFPPQHSFSSGISHRFSLGSYPPPISVPVVCMVVPPVATGEAGDSDLAKWQEKQRKLPCNY